VPIRRKAFGIPGGCRPRRGPVPAVQVVRTSTPRIAFLESAFAARDPVPAVQVVPDGVHEKGRVDTQDVQFHGFIGFRDIRPLDQSHLVLLDPFHAAVGSQLVQNGPVGNIPTVAPHQLLETVRGSGHTQQQGLPLPVQEILVPPPPGDHTGAAVVPVPVPAVFRFMKPNNPPDFLAG
jgi:hypothetical protein